MHHLKRRRTWEVQLSGMLSLNWCHWWQIAAPCMSTIVVSLCSLNYTVKCLIIMRISWEHKFCTILHYIQYYIGSTILQVNTRTCIYTHALTYRWKGHYKVRSNSSCPARAAVSHQQSFSDQLRASTTKSACKKHLVGHHMKQIIPKGSTIVMYSLAIACCAPIQPHPF